MYRGSESEAPCDAVGWEESDSHSPFRRLKRLSSTIVPAWRSVCEAAYSACMVQHMRIWQSFIILLVSQAAVEDATVTHPCDPGEGW